MIKFVKKWISETIHHHNEKKRIKAWLDEYKISNYIIQPNLTVDVLSSVDLSNRGLTEIPVQFGNVFGHFVCNENNLTSLKGCPEKVTGLFDCSKNNLQSLEYCPTTIGQSFFCSNNKLTSLKYGPTVCGEHYYCFSNQLTTLEFGPDVVEGEFNCVENNLESFKFCPRKVKSFYCSSDKIDDFDDLTTQIEDKFCFNGKYFPFLHQFYSFKPPFESKEEEYNSVCVVPGEVFRQIQSSKALSEQLKDELKVNNKPIKRPKL